MQPCGHPLQHVAGQPRVGAGDADVEHRRAGLHDPVMDDFLRGLTEDEQKQALARANRLR